MTRWSLLIGKAFGIKIFIHWTFIFIFLWVLYINFQQGNSLGDSVYILLFVLTLFLCVVLHELGHALAARRYGIGTKDIILLPIGGMARLESMPEKPDEELVVALAGPMVNVLIALILYIPLKLLIGFQDYSTLEGALLIGKDNFIELLFYVNIILVAFNMIPAFPMDGGRVMRALLAYRFNRAKATMIAARTGQAFALLFFIGSFIIMNPFLIIIGIFVFFAARAEASFVKTKFALGGHQVKELMMDIFTPLYTDETLSRAAKALLDGQEQEFVVLNREGAFVGILSREDILKGLSTFGKDCIIEKVVNPNVPGINADDQIEEVFFNMSKNQFDALPVLDDGKVIGVINRENIMEFIWIKEAVDKNLSA